MGWMMVDVSALQRCGKPSAVLEGSETYLT